MKKPVIGFVLIITAFYATAALAQSQVTVYGLVDSGLVYTDNVNASGDSVVKVPSLSGSFPSRLGFRGTEDLGNGLQAFFVLENGFSTDSGSTGQGGRLFGRQANVGIKGPYGTVTIGRQNNMTYLSAIKSDVLGPNLFSIGSIDLYLPNARTDNAIGYVGVFSNLTFGATYSFGRDASNAGGPAATNCPGEVPNNSKACRQITTLLAYDSKNFGISTSYDLLNGNLSAAGGLVSSDNDDKRITINGYLVLNSTKLGAGVISRKTRAVTGTTESNLYYLGATYHLAPSIFVDAQVAHRDTKSSDSDVTMAVARITYGLSKRTALYSAIGQMRNDGQSAVALDAGGTAGPGKNQNGIMAGLRHSF